MLSAVDQLILDLGQGDRRATGRDLEAIRLHVAQAGFDPLATFRADRRVIGLRRSNGEIIRPGDRLPASELHYLRHVVRQQEWPPGTTQAQYEDSLLNLALRLRVGMLVREIPPFGWHVGIVGRTGVLRGPRGFDWLLVEYRVSTEHWSTGFQPVQGLQFANGRRRRRWRRLST